MSDDIFGFLRLGDVPEPSEVTFAEGRLTTRTYATRSFIAAFGRDVGHPTRYIYRVFDEAQPEQDDEHEWVKDVVYTTPGARKQLQLQVAREAGAVRKLRIQKVPLVGDLTKLETILELDRDQATRLVDMLRAIDMIPVEGDSSVHVDDQLLETSSVTPRPSPASMRKILNDFERSSRAMPMLMTSSLFSAVVKWPSACASGWTTRQRLMRQPRTPVAQSEPGSAYSRRTPGS